MKTREGDSGTRGSLLSAAFNPSGKRRVLAASLAAGCVVVALLAGGFVHAQRLAKRRQINRVLDRLEALAEARRAAVGTWLAERRADVEVLAWDPDLVSLCAGGACPRDLPETHFQAHLENLMRFRGVVGAYLFSPDGELVLKAAGSPPPCPGAAPMARRAAREGRFLLHGLHTPPGGQPLVGFLVPVVSAPGPDPDPAGADVVGVAALYLDPLKTLWPMLQAGEPEDSGIRCYLVFRSGDGRPSVFPGGLLGAGDDGVLGRGSAVAAALELRQMRGRFVGLGGQPALAALRWITEAGWGLVVEMDEEAALAPWRREAVYEGLMAASGILSLILAWVAAWRTWTGIRYRRLLEEVRERGEQLQALAQGSGDVIFLKDRAGRYLLVNPASARVLGVPPERALGRTAADFLPRKAAETVMARDQKVLESGEPLHGEEVFTVEGEPRIFLSVRVPIRDGTGRIQGVAGVLRDITDRKRWEDELARRARALDGLYRLASRLALADTEPDVLHALVEGAVAAFQADMASVYRLDPERGDLYLAAGQNLPKPFQARYARIPRDHGVTGEAFLGAQTLVLEHYAEHPRAVQAAADLSGVRSVAAVPLKAEGRVLGVLSLGFRSVRKFAAHEREALETVGHMAGVALERSNALAALRVEAENRRRAEQRLRRLHETTAALTGSALFQRTAEVLCGELGCRWVMVVRARPESATAIPLAAADRGTPMELPPYPLEGTPCQDVVATGAPLILTRGAGERFPKAPFLQRHGVEAYLGYPLWDSRGRVLGTLCVFHDAPVEFGPAEQDLVALYAQRAAGELERLAAEEQLAETRRSLEALIENLPGMVYRCANRPDRSPVVFVSSAVRTVLGCEAGQVVDQPGRGLEHWVVPEDRPRVAREIERALSQGRAYEVEYRVHDAGGGVRWVFDIGREVRDAEGRGWIEGVLFDQTERRALEAQLTHSQRMEALGRLAGGVAHDFNNLLTAISGYAEILVRRLAQDEKGGRAAKEILKAVDRAAHLTRQLLTFSRRQVVEPKRVSINDVLRDLAGMLERVIGEDVRLHFDLEDGTGTVRADPGQLEQVVLNLVVNARDAMPTGGDLWIRTRRVSRRPPEAEKTLEYAVIEVEDTGVGIPQEVMEHIFEPFFTTKGQEHGTGLGLSTVYGIVRQAGGLIEVESEPGAGTVFRVFWPVMGAEAVFEDVQKPPSREGVPFEGLVAALVEDDRWVRELAAEALDSLGFRVLAFESGEAAEAGLKQESRVDVVVTDVVMAGMRGPELLKRLRERWPGLPAVLISGHVGRGEALLDLPGTVFLQKPFRMAELERAVERVLRGVDAAQRAAAP